MCGLLFQMQHARPDDTELQQRGLEIFVEQCADCHGEHGEGTVDVPSPLFGDRLTIELSDIITRTMPDGSPEDCVGDDSAAVAAWMQQAFYSPEAQARLNPPRIQLSRLTVSQYRNAIADLMTSFRWSAEPDGLNGLKAEYYSHRSFRGNHRVVQRIDPRVSFDYGKGSPDGEKIAEKQFSGRWTGSVIVHETGLHDFVVHSENGVRLYVNDSKKALIDAWVKSGDDSEFTGTRYLIAGRIYPITLEWFKFNEETASIELRWKVPQGVEEVIPPHRLTPQSSPQILVVETPFPPDDRSDGYERGTAVSREWDDATTWAAIEVADKVVDALPSLASEKKGEDRDAAIRTFATEFVERAFRRPLTDDMKRVFVDSHFEDLGITGDAIRRMVLLTLKSPRFLFREVTGQDDQFAVAERLAFALTDSIPDVKLLELAKRGELKTRQQIRDQAWRLVNDYRAENHLRTHLEHWLNLGRLHDLSKDSEVFSDFNPAVAHDLRASLELLLNDVVQDDEPGLNQLLLAETTYLNHRLGQFYGAAVPDDGAFHTVDFETDRRSGVLTHPFIMTGLAYTATSSPIHRGVMLSRGILGRAIKPPPIAVAPTAPELSPELTTRERVIVQTSADVCANCHKTINALGFALENFDAVGRYRELEKGKPVDASGGFVQRSGARVEFRGAKELVNFVARSEETHRSFARQLFHHMIQQPVLAYGPETLTELTRFFEDSDLKLHALMVEIACRDAGRLYEPDSRKVASGTSVSR
jgi:Protein of unknown function (DUF1592)/Protein of unknown function (DUF1588)/PA14 domain/Cytochrome C oxidase, cbb3-type, subunit III